MNDPTRPTLDGLDIGLARRINAICRRFEADWRAGPRPAIADYSHDVPEEGRVAIRIELEALERELRQAEETTAPRARRRPHPVPGRLIGPRGGHGGPPRPGHDRSRIIRAARGTRAGADPVLRRLRDRERAGARRQGRRLQGAADEPLVLAGYTHWMMDRALSPSDDRLVSSGMDAALRIWPSPGARVASSVSDPIGPRSDEPPPPAR
jgi:hypothetical protein